MVTCNGQWCVRLPYGAMLRNTIDSFMAIIRHFEVAEETGLNFVHKAIPQCNLTPRKNNRSGVTLKGFPEPERVL